MKRHIPNIITCLNVTCGALAILIAAHFGNLDLAVLFILLGMVFDFFDGMTARALHVKSEMGKELDSLADVCSFGVAPAIVAYLLMSDANTSYSWLAYSAFVIPALSAYRLAKFNLDLRQTVNFIGMPTPANALFWVGLVLGAKWAPNIYNTIFESPIVLAVFAVALSVALISELPMFSLKLSGFGWKGNEVRYIYFLIAAALFLVVGLGAVMFIIPLYLVVCLVAFYMSATKSK